jgi:2-dehydro-3-deoxyphosphogluconate aldolase/(4S)-4-hydroxy-2-oxoglutarate aldolase
MARFSRLEVLNETLRIGLVPVFYNSRVEAAKKVVSACAAGGARVVEFTNRGDNAYRVFSDLVLHFAQEDPSVILGVGSVLDPATAALYISSGANFVVGPVLNAEVAKLCNRRKVAYSPGCGSASEISAAEELGVEIVKVFPGDAVGGPSFVKTILGPMPWTKIMPTGGVEATRESIQAWFKAGIAAAGIGSNLIKQELVEKGEFDTISANAAQVISWIREARGESVFTGIEHPGLYPYQGASAADIANWYGETFGMKVKEGNSSFFVSGSGPGRLEIMKEGDTDRCHVAIRVSDFEAACESLKVKGIELEQPKAKGAVKAVFLKNPDPAGNRVHLFWSV